MGDDISPDQTEIDWGPTSSKEMADYIFDWCERNWDRYQIGVALKELQAEQDKAQFISDRAELARKSMR